MNAEPPMLFGGSSHKDLTLLQSVLTETMVDLMPKDRRAGGQFRVLAHALLLAGVLLLRVAEMPVLGQEAPIDDRGLELVRRGLAAQSLENAPTDIRTLMLRGHGTRYWRGQGRSPEQPIGELPFHIELSVDFENRRILASRTTYQGWAPYFSFTSVYRTSGGFNVENVADVLMPMSDGAAAQTLDRLLDRQPAPRKRLTDAVENPSTVRYVGPATLDGDTFDVVTYTNSEDQSWQVYLDEESHLLMRAVQVDTVRLLLGDVVMEERYGDYRAIGPVTVPFYVRQMYARTAGIGAVIVDEFQYEAGRIDVPIPDSLIQVPDDLTTRRPDTEVAISEIRDGVFFIENAVPNYNQLLLEFDEYLLVLDAPRNSEVSEAVISAIHEEVPGKPIRYVVASHFHYDHMGGVPAYAAQGATVVTTPGNRTFMTDLIAREASTMNVGPALPNQAAQIELVERKRIVSDGRLKVELYDVGPNPHVDELLVAYVPERKILYVADVFSADWGKVRPAIPETFVFADSLAALGLDVEIMLPGHGPRATIDDFKRSLEEGEVMRTELSGPVSEDPWSPTDSWRGCGLVIRR